MVFLEASGREIRAVVQEEAGVQERETVFVGLQAERAFPFDERGQRL